MALLLDTDGVDLGIVNTAGDTALHTACGKGQVEAVRLLLMAGRMIVYLI